MTKQSVRPYMIAFIVLAVSVGWLWYFWRGVLTEHRQLQNLQVELNQIRQTASLLTYQRDLALEFDLSPAIVIAVDNRSREVVDSSKEEWKYIPNHQFCTFLILSLIHVESGGQMIVGDGGRAIGPSQIWLTTARLYNPKLSKDELMQPEVNVDYTFRHFVARLKARHGNFAEVLYDWNRGEAKVDKLVKMGKPIENGYGGKVYKARR